MNLKQVSAKMDLRLNKAASGDYDNIWKYQKQEALNKAVNSWVRRTKRGKNATQEGDEETTSRIDDLQVLLTTDVLSTKNKGNYNETQKIPTDYLYYKRLTPVASKGKCSNGSMKSHLREEANVDDLRYLPSFKFEETFHTMINNKFNVYHFKDFEVNTVLLTYYRKPKFYDFSKLTTQMEFKDDNCEQIIDIAISLLSSDIESFNQKGMADEREMKDD